MADYRQIAVVGTSRRRCSSINVSNPRNAAPSVVFSEETVITIDGEEITTGVESSLIGQFDPTASFPLLNPDTGEKVGKATHAELYVMLHSLYMDQAKQRDGLRPKQRDGLRPKQRTAGVAT